MTRFAILFTEKKRQKPSRVRANEGILQWDAKENAQGHKILSSIFYGSEVSSASFTAALIGRNSALLKNTEQLGTWFRNVSETRERERERERERRVF